MLKINSNIDLLKDYAQYLTLSGRKPATVRYLIQSLKILIDRKVRLSENSNILEYLSDNSSKFSSSHLNSFVTTLRDYAHFCDEKGKPYDPIFKNLKYFKDKYKPKATMSDSEIEDLLTLPPPKQYCGHKGSTKGFYHVVNPKSYRYWTVFFTIMAFTGMRPGEVANMKVQDVDFGRSIFILPDTKTNEPRFVPIPPNVTSLVQEWVKEQQTGYLFKSSRPEGHTSNVEWHYNFQTRIKRLGIVRTNLTPYSLRHSLITRLLEEDVNIFKVQRIVGHHDLRTTSIYTHMTTKDLAIAIRKHPLIMKHTDAKTILDAIEQYIAGLGIDSRFYIKKQREENLLSFEIKFRR